MLFFIRFKNSYKFCFVLIFSGNKKAEPCVLIFIPDGSKKEPPTTFMSITNQTYFTVLASEENDKKASAKKQNAVAAAAVKPVVNDAVINF